MIILIIDKSEKKIVSRGIMTQNNNEKIIEKAERMTEEQEHNKERTGRFLPIFFWTD